MDVNRYILIQLTSPINMQSLYNNGTTLKAMDETLIVNRTFPYRDMNDIEIPKESPWFYWLPGPCICVFGIVCNILNVCVLAQKQLKESPYIYLRALALSDLMLLTISFIHLCLSNAPNTLFKTFYNIYLFFAIANVFYNSSIWIIVALTFERMVYVINPMRKRAPRMRTRMYIVLIFSLSAFTNLPRFFCYHIQSVDNQVVPAGTLFKESSLYFRLSWIQAIFINFIPAGILLITNASLIYALRKAANKRHQLGCTREAANLRDQTRLTRTLIAIVVMFYICAIPSAFADDPIAFTVFGGDSTWEEFLNSDLSNLYTYVSNILIFLNSSLNFVLYCAFNKKFRVATTNFLLMLRKGNARGSALHSQTGVNRKTLIKQQTRATL